MIGRPKGISKWTADYTDSVLPDGVTILRPIPNPFNAEVSHTFIDPLHGMWNTSCREMIKQGHSTHPKRAAARRAIFYQNNPEYKTQIRKQAMITTKSRYTSEEMIARQIAGNQKAHGVAWASQTEEFRTAIKQSNLLKYGVENPSQSVEVNTTALILPNGKMLTTYCKELNREFAKSWAKYLFHNISPTSAQEYIDTVENECSYLETQFTKLTGMPLHNKRVLEARAFRPDFLHEKIAIDVDGLQCHSDQRKAPRYHFEKRMAYEMEGFTLLQFRQDEIHFKPDIVQSIVNAKLGKITEKYYTRKLTLTKSSYADTKSFFDKNHLMGSSPGAKVLVLHNGTEIISAISYRKYKTGIDIVRFCNKLNVVAVGALSKFISEIQKQEQPEFIQSFVDLRYGNGNSLTSIGFKLASVNLSWKWTDGIRTYNRLQCKANMDERNLSEKEHAKELGWNRIYDAGQAKFIF